MNDDNAPSSITVGELSRLVHEFEERILDGTEDPDRFLTLAEIEELWGKLIGDTTVLYSNMLQDLISSVDEKEIIRKKKRISEKRDPAEES